MQTLLAVGLANPITVDPTIFNFQLSQSISGFTVWTAPATRRITNSDTVAPATSRSILQVSCAMEEFESFQVIISPTSAFANFKVNLAAFPGVGATQRMDIGYAQFTAGSAQAQPAGFTIADNTVPVTQGTTNVPLSSSLPTVLWLTLYVPQAGTTAGSRANVNLVLTVGSNTITIPVALYVYNFVLKKTAHFKTQMFGLPNRCPATGCNTIPMLDTWKQVYLEHRLTPNYPAWPNGINFGAGAWTCATHTLDLMPTQTCPYSNGCTIQRYCLGQGNTWNGVTYPAWIDDGFPNWMAINTDSGMPSTCGVSCGNSDGYSCTTAYFTEWNRYILAVRDYLISMNLLEKSYWYTQNEPQNMADYTRSAHMCAIARAAAPGLKIMVSRGARPEIAENPTYPNCGYDIWLAHLSNYFAPYIWERQVNQGEESWMYTLDTDNLCQGPNQCGPSFCPAISNSGNNGAEDPKPTMPGPHYRVMFWVAWVNRITGWGYYKDQIFWDETWAAAPNPARPRIAAALLREGLEDYEYLYMANGNTDYPQAYTKLAVDDTAMSLGFCFYSWNSDPNAFHAIRNELGRKIEGTRADFPYIAPLNTRPFGNYYIDFKNAGGVHTPFAFGGKSWIPIGWDIFDVSLGFGWCSPTIGLTNPLINMYSTTGSGNTIEQTIMFNDYADRDNFYFSVAPGTYNVTVAVGWPGSCRNGDTEYIQVNGVIIREFKCATAPGTCCGVRTYSNTVVVKGNSMLVMNVCPIYDSGNDYTIFTYMMIEGLVSSTTVNTAATATTAAAVVASTNAATSTSLAATSNSASTTNAVVTANAATIAVTTTASTTRAVTSVAATTAAVITTTASNAATTSNAITAANANAATVAAMTSTTAAVSTSVSAATVAATAAVSTSTTTNAAAAAVAATVAATSSAAVVASTNAAASTGAVTSSVSAAATSAAAATTSTASSSYALDSITAATSTASATTSATTTTAASVTIAATTSASATSAAITNAASTSGVTTSAAASTSSASTSAVTTNAVTNTVAVSTGGTTAAATTSVAATTSSTVSTQAASTSAIVSTQAVSTTSASSTSVASTSSLSAAATSMISSTTAVAGSTAAVSSTSASVSAATSSVAVTSTTAASSVSTNAVSTSITEASTVVAASGTSAAASTTNAQSSSLATSTTSAAVTSAAATSAASVAATNTGVTSSTVAVTSAAATSSASTTAALASTSSSFTTALAVDATSATVSASAQATTTEIMSSIAATTQAASASADSTTVSIATATTDVATSLATVVTSSNTVSLSTSAAVTSATLATSASSATTGTEQETYYVTGNTDTCIDPAQLFDELSVALSIPRDHFILDSYSCTKRAGTLVMHIRGDTDGSVSNRVANYINSNLQIGVASATVTRSRSGKKSELPLPIWAFVAIGIGALVLIAAIVGLIVFFVLRGKGSSSSAHTRRHNQSEWMEEELYGTGAGAYSTTPYRAL